MAGNRENKKTKLNKDGKEVVGYDPIDVPKPAPRKDKAKPNAKTRRRHKKRAEAAATNATEGIKDRASV